jgi:E3 SUMO-protein ligase PIAS1
LAIQIKSCGDDTSEIDVKPDGSWRVKGRAELKDLKQWHLPDGTLCVATDTEAKPKMCTVKHEVKEEPPSEEAGCRLKLGIRKNSNGQWEISKRGDGDSVLSSDNHMENKDCINLTCSTDETDIGDEAYNSEPGRNDYPMAHVHDLDSSPSDENAPPPSMEQDVIVLSDSDDDDVTVVSPSAVKCGSAHGTGNLTSGVCGEELGGCPNETSFLALKEGFDDLGLSFWERPLSPRDDPTYQMFDPGARVTDNPGEVDGPVCGGNLGGTAEAANPPEGSVANLGGADESSNDRNAGQKRRNPPGSGITASDGKAEMVQQLLLV